MWFEPDPTTSWRRLATNWAIQHSMECSIQCWVPSVASLSWNLGRGAWFKSQNNDVSEVLLVESTRTFLNGGINENVTEQKTYAVVGDVDVGRFLVTANGWVEVIASAGSEAGAEGWGVEAVVGERLAGAFWQHLQVLELRRLRVVGKLWTRHNN